MLHSELKQSGLNAFALAAIFACLFCCAAWSVQAGSDGNKASAAVMDGDGASAPLEKFKVEGNDRVLKADADWAVDLPSFGELLKLDYTADGKRLVVYGADEMLLVDARSGELIGAFKHGFNPDDRRVSDFTVTPGNVGVNRDGSLAAVGVKSGRPREEGPSGIVLVTTDGSAEPDTILFDGNYGNVVASRFLPDDRRLALCLFEDIGVNLDVISGGRYGIYDYVDKHWHWFTQDTAAASVEVSPSGRYVIFDVYGYRYDFEGSATRVTEFGRGQLIDVDQAAEASTLLKRAGIKVAADDETRLYFRYSRSGGSLPEVLYHGAGNFRAIRVQGDVGNGFLIDAERGLLIDGESGAFIDAERYVYLRSYYKEGRAELGLIDPETGEALTTDCSWDKSVTAFAVSPDGKKIALLGDGLLWQEDFECLD